MQHFELAVHEELQYSALLFAGVEYAKHATKH